MIRLSATALFVLLASAGGLAAPSSAEAQGPSRIPPQGSPQSAPAKPHPPKGPVAWSSLSPGQQRMLTPVQGQWTRMRPARQHRLATHALHWATLAPDNQQQIRERLTRWAAMTPEQHRQLRENARAFHDLSPTERAKVSEAFKKFQALPPEQRRALRERWRAMSPEQRQRWVTEHPDQPVPAHPPAHGGI